MPDVDREQVAERLRQSEARYRQVVDSIGEVIFETDAQGRWLSLNRAWEAITGFPVADTLGQCWFDYVHPEDRQSALELFAALIARRRDPSRSEVRHLHGDGGFRWFEVFIRPTLGESDAVLGATGILADITARKVAETATERALAETRRLVQVRNDFLANMSHEIRTPAQRDSRAGAGRAPTPVRAVGAALFRADRGCRSAAARGGQRHPRFLEDRGRQAGPGASAFRSRPGDRPGVDAGRAPSLRQGTGLGPGRAGRSAADLVGRWLSAVSGAVEFARQRGEIHRARRSDAGGAARSRAERVRRNRVSRRGYRRRDDGRATGSAVSTVPAGRQLHHPAVRGHRLGFGHLQAAGGHDGGPARRGQPAGPGFGVRAADSPVAGRRDRQIDCGVAFGSPWSG
jgi:PAS domain S-box-containing protein